MTIDQETVIWEMRRQGLHRLAYLTEQRWKQGKIVERSATLQAKRHIWTLVERCNRQI